MDADDLIMVSVDDLSVSPRRCSRADCRPSFRTGLRMSKRLADGSDVWLFNGTKIPNIGLNAVAGRPKEEYGIEPTAFDEMRPGCYDVHERIKDMNAGGVLGLDDFPIVSGVRRRAVAACPDKELALAVSAPTTIGTSTSGAVRTPAGSSRWRCQSSGLRPLCRGSTAGSCQGVPLAHLHGEPGQARLPELS